MLRLACHSPGLVSEVSINPQTVAGRHEIRLVSFEIGRRRGEAQRLHRVASDGDDQ